jgi:hypothetical protein
MPSPGLLRVGSVLLVVGVAACADSVPVSPARVSDAPSLAASTSDSNEPTMVSPQLDQINVQLANAKSNLRIAKAELRMNDRYDGVTSTTIFANDRFRGVGAEWVKGDPRRDGNPGVTYQNASGLGVRPFVINPDRATFAQTSYAVLDQQVEEGMQAWRERACSAAPITRVAIPAGTDPNQLDQFFASVPPGAPSANYAQTADIVLGGWMVPQFFRNIAILSGSPPATGDNIIGITFSFIFVDQNNNATDIDRNKKADLGLSEIYYNARFVYDNSGLYDPRVIDFYSVLAHESGHGLGLGHLGKIFVTKHDAADGIQLSDVKLAPKALMNASYLAGRDEIVGLDNSQFCQIWASR